jgi:hypothetical protein
MIETYRFENFTMRKLQIKELCRTSDTNLKMYLKEEIKLAVSFPEDTFYVSQWWWTNILTSNVINKRKVTKLHHLWLSIQNITYTCQGLTQEYINQGCLNTQANKFCMI